MNKIVDPLINLASNNLQAVSEVVAGAPRIDPVRLNGLWRSTLENQARFVSECTDCLLYQMSRNRLLISNQMKRMSASTEHLTAVISHAAVRSLAIATNARHIDRDRRVFSLPLPRPAERRFHVVPDRRLAASGPAPIPGSGPHHSTALVDDH